MSQRSTGKPCNKVGQQVSVANARYKIPATDTSKQKSSTPNGGIAPLKGNPGLVFKGGPGPSKNKKSPNVRTVSARITGANDMSQLEKFRRSMSKDL